MRSLFIAHWIDNAFAGAALEGGARGAFINTFNRLQTGRWFRTGSCPQAGEGEEVDTLTQGELQVLASFFPITQPIADEGMPSYPPGRQCNARGLTALGRHLVMRMMDLHMLIEVDHLSERARARVLLMAERRRYPLVSSHTDTGGTWPGKDLRRLYATGGFAVSRPDTAGPLAARVVELARLSRRVRGAGVGLGSDTGGFAALPGPRPDAGVNPLRYPFRSIDGKWSSTGSAPVSGRSTSTSTASPTTRCSPTSWPTCAPAGGAVRRWRCCSGRPRRTCAPGGWRCGGEPGARGCP